MPFAFDSPHALNYAFMNKTHTAEPKDTRTIAMLQRQKKQIQRILVIRTGNLGAVVDTFPAVVYLRKTFPHAHITYMTTEPYADLLDPCPHVNEIMVYKENGVLAGARFGRGLKARGFDLVLNFENTRKFDVISRLAGAKFRSPLIDPERPLSGLEFVSEILRETGLDPQRRYREFWFSPDDNIYAAHFRMDHEIYEHHRIIGLHPGGTWITKCWPSQNFVRLVERLATLPNMRFLLFGAPSEVERAEEVSAAASQPVINMAGLTTIRQAARLIRECALFIGNDSGLLHATAMMDIPAIGIFGPTNPMHHGPAGESLTAVYRGVECAPCASPECTLDDEQLFCLTSVPVDEIFNNARKMLR